MQKVEACLQIPAESSYKKYKKLAPCILRKQNEDPGILVRGFPSGSAVTNPLAMQEMQETWTRSLGREDPLEEGMATRSGILA